MAPPGSDAETGARIVSQEPMISVVVVFRNPSFRVDETGFVDSARRANASSDWPFLEANCQALSRWLVGLIDRAIEEGARWYSPVGTSTRQTTRDTELCGVALPQGGYTVSSPNLDCSTASADFTTFLDKYNGAIPGWTATSSVAGRGTFTQRGTGKQFTVTHTR